VERRSPDDGFPSFSGLGFPGGGRDRPGYETPGRRKPREEGSWPPEMNWVRVSGGRIYATAINVLTLETYYRYQPFCKLMKTSN
jgi:hypothetical protein